jgi:hypothetical protein
MPNDTLIGQWAIRGHAEDGVTPITISAFHNLEHDGMELHFSAKPERRALDIVHLRYRFRFSRRLFWYKKWDPDVLAKVHDDLVALNGRAAPAPAEEPVITFTKAQIVPTRGGGYVAVPMPGPELEDVDMPAGWEIDSAWTGKVVEPEPVQDLPLTPSFTVREVGLRGGKTVVLIERQKVIRDDKIARLEGPIVVFHGVLNTMSLPYLEQIGVPAALYQGLVR